ncbi:MAG: hypothetical protein A2270_04970 [Elusimicrobia bacterium RIFOXYA12_FULL_51_18]|nr:MAG: hypothetical protein A2270_04970 [Elusimicrobia bacterium RIFOXYA12_FULL_51_18]OGS30972.1 MAG: hypothetical protein A2218_07695 [Elusimicrobia bacterium RIFOXYA2_FULL_53_38]
MNHYKLRLKDPSGAEFEAEGPIEFILNEKACFLEDLKHRPPVLKTQDAPDQYGPACETGFWDKIIVFKNDLAELRVKSPEIDAAEAALILMSASRAINRKEDLSAITLSKTLKTSGYEPERLDRLLAKEIKEGRATASGTKRNRTYHITPKGMEKAYLAIKKLEPTNP